MRFLFTDDAFAFEALRVTGYAAMAVLTSVR
jgi:hypothetical protein